MAAYTIAMTDVKDAARYGAYSERAPEVFKAFGATVRVRGGRVAALEGPVPPERNVIAEFSDMDRVRDWFGSPAFADLHKLREGAAEVCLFALPGEPLTLAAGRKPGYFVAKVTVRDADAYGAYVKDAVALVQAAGGVFTARGEIVPLEGEERFREGLIITFPSFAEARDFYYSDAYQAIIPKRDGAADVQFFVLEGA